MEDKKISKESREILRDDISKKLIMHIMSEVKLDNSSKLVKILDFFKDSDNDVYKKISPYYGTYRAKQYFIEAFRRREGKSMTYKEENYLFNTDFRKVTEDYLNGRITFK